MATSTELSKRSTIAPLPRRLIFVILAAFIGFAAGISIASLFVPDGIGLAGPAFAVSYGVAGFWIAAVAAFVATRRMSTGTFRRAMLTVCTLSLVLWSWVAWRAMTRVPATDPVPGLVEPVDAPVPGPPTDRG